MRAVVHVAEYGTPPPGPAGRGAVARGPRPRTPSPRAAPGTVSVCAPVRTSPVSHRPAGTAPGRCRGRSRPAATRFPKYQDPSGHAVAARRADAARATARTARQPAPSSAGHLGRPLAPRPFAVTAAPRSGHRPRDTDPPRQRHRRGPKRLDPGPSRRTASPSRQAGTTQPPPAQRRPPTRPPATHSNRHHRAPDASIRAVAVRRWPSRRARHPRGRPNSCPSRCGSPGAPSRHSTRPAPGTDAGGRVGPGGRGAAGGVVAAVVEGVRLRCPGGLRRPGAFPWPGGLPGVPPGRRGRRRGWCEPRAAVPPRGGW